CLLALFTSLFVFYVLLLLSFFNDTTTTDIYTLSLHDALPISQFLRFFVFIGTVRFGFKVTCIQKFFISLYFRKTNWGIISLFRVDRKSTRLNSSHVKISYAVFCLKNKK